MDKIDIKIVLKALENILDGVKTIQEIMQIEVEKFKNLENKK